MSTQKKIAPMDLLVPRTAAPAKVPIVQGAVHKEEAAHALAWVRLAGWVERTAQGLASDGMAVAADLVAEAQHEFWELDPSRCDLAGEPNDEIWFKRELRRAMRRERDDEIKRRGIRSAVPFRVRLLATGAIEL